MSRKKLYLHIGQYKTGSSSLQNFLFSNRTKLQEYGFHYCETGLTITEPSIGIRHYHLTLHTMSKECLWSSLASEINDGQWNKYIISYENLLFGFGPNDLSERLAYISSKLSGIDIHVICYLRRQDEFMSSWYAEHIKSHKYSKTFDEFSNHYKKLCFYGDALDKWKYAFPEAEFSIASYNELKRNNTSVVEHFLSLCALDKQNFNSESVSNKSLGAQGCIEMIEFNCLADQTMYLHRKISNLLIDILSDDRPACFFSEQQALKFLSLFKEDTKKLKELFSIDDSFFSDGFLSKPEFMEPFIGKKLAEIFLPIQSSIETLNSKDVDLIRNSADLLAENHRLGALKLMRLAQKLRPEGPYINKRIKELSG
jgi:hypothetical protein